MHLLRCTTTYECHTWNCKTNKRPMSPIAHLSNNRHYDNKISFMESYKNIWTMKWNRSSAKKKFKNLYYEKHSALFVTGWIYSNVTYWVLQFLRIFLITIIYNYIHFNLHQTWNFFKAQLLSMGPSLNNQESTMCQNACVWV